MVDRDNAQTAGWTVFGVAVCAAFAVFVHGCSNTLQNSDRIELQKREACLAHGGSALAGPNGITQCLVLNSKN